MIYWAIELEEDVRGVYLQNEELLKFSIRNGHHPPTIRQAFVESSQPEPIFQVIAKNGNSVLSRKQKLGDFLMWGVVRIFSQRARDMAVGLGCDANDFWQCGFDTNPQEKFFMFLSDKKHDIVDVEQSEFLNRIQVPGKSPILIHMVNLVLKTTDAYRLPPCFFAPMPGYDQVLSTLFINDYFKSTWEQLGFTGAQFRMLMR